MVYLQNSYTTNIAGLNSRTQYKDNPFLRYTKVLSPLHFGHGQFQRPKKR